MTTLEGAAFNPEGLDPGNIRRPHSYLAFHVEPLLLAFAPLLLVTPDPRALLWLQAAAIAAGALPAAWLARRVHGRASVGLVFGVAYLLAPGLEGAALSDFHLVAVASLWLMLALWALESGRPRLAIAMAALAALSREDAAAIVGWVGLLLVVETIWKLRARRLPGWRTGMPPESAPISRRIVGRNLATGIGFLLIGGTLALVDVAVVAPYFNGGGSLFWSRYEWLGATPQAAVANLYTDPRILMSRLAVRDVQAYVALQVLTGGGLTLLAPSHFLAGAPLVAINALSSFEWMRSGGAHYSALVVPLLIRAGVHGSRAASSWLGKARWCAFAIVLASALGAHVWIGVSPLRAGFVWPEADPRAGSVLNELARIPPDDAVSATSALYPHLAQRSRAYWFPVVEDARWIALDALGTTHPLTARETREKALELLATGGVELRVARDGLLLFERTGQHADDPRPPVGPTSVRLPDEFFRPLRALDRSDGLPSGFTSASLGFGEELRLIGYRVERWPEVGLFGDSLTLETIWSAEHPIAEDRSFRLVTTRQPDGAIIGRVDDAAPGALWLPTSAWVPGERVRLTMTAIPLRGVQAVGIAVLDSHGRQLGVSGIEANVAVQTGEDDTIAMLVRLDR